MAELTQEDKMLLTVGADVYAKAMEIACGMATKIELGKFVLNIKIDDHQNQMDKKLKIAIIQEVIDKIESLPDPILSMYDRGPGSPPGNAYVPLNKAIIVTTIRNMLETL